VELFPTISYAPISGNVSRDFPVISFKELIVEWPALRVGDVLIVDREYVLAVLGVVINNGSALIP
jgi:hypothetical protein